MLFFVGKYIFYLEIQNNDLKKTKKKNSAMLLILLKRGTKL